MIAGSLLKNIEDPANSTVSVCLLINERNNRCLYKFSNHFFG